jgi:hypothetical protein
MRKYYLLLAAAVFLLTTWASAKNQPKFKSIEVKHFPNAEGVELPPEFSDFLYAELKETLQKKNLAEQLIGEDEVVDSADAAHSVILEGSVLEYKKGSVVKEQLTRGWGGGRSLTAHVKMLRRSNNEVMIDKDIKVGVPAMADAKHLARFLAGKIAGEMKHEDR